MTVAQIDAKLASLPDTTTASVRGVRREISLALKTAPAQEVLRLAQDLVDAGGWQRRFIAYEIVSSHRGARSSVNERSALALGAGIADWAAVDTFACYIAGPAWREGQLSDKAIRAWAVSRDRWWRRTAVVCTVALNNRARGGKGDVARTLDICERVLDDRDDMVVKALSWALREVSKRDADAVLAFLSKHGSRLAPRVLREVRTKMTTGLKSPRKARRS